MNIVMMMTGSIACAKAAGLISEWTQAGHQVKVVCSAAALEFVGKATLEGLSQHAVLDDTYAEGDMMQHIHLSRWADQIIICPATAHVINKLAAGLADDMLTTTWVAGLSLGKPMFIAPAMNTMMWQYPATQQSVEKLQQWGVQFLMPQAGNLACGETGAGRMLEPVQISAEFLGAQSNGKKILITAGGTREYIDGVRYIGNMSSGKTGAQMADYFSAQGYQVTWVGARDAQRPQRDCQQLPFETFSELQTLLQQQLSNTHFDAVIHAAAVSDYSIDSLSVCDEQANVCRQSKLPTADSLNISLKKNPKLIKQLGQWSTNPDITVVGFKLTNSQCMQERLQAVKKLIEQPHIALVAHNDLAEITPQQHGFELYSSVDSKQPCQSVDELCEQIDKHLEPVS
ncbi:bifunctional phosphopantothenoylcysteine decarboxylase/phosphopantothenate--cysteine ligase CoaBC [Marinicella sp. W31]|uniref:bifunctional phosphopantothenoylcysteine decarboxylase/phosphopantothenate--cysteine ligase CoaBC n=1 Tax=Marinicella sp. W31 TaxID=3023713 RepID=UPI003757C480